MSAGFMPCGKRCLKKFFENAKKCLLTYASQLLLWKKTSTSYHILLWSNTSSYSTIAYTEKWTQIYEKKSQCNKWSDIAKSLVVLILFPIKFEVPCAQML